MKLPAWLRRRTRQTGTVTVEVTLPDFELYIDALRFAERPMITAARRIARRQAARERQILAAWWDDHLDHLYADLGLERP